MATIADVARAAGVSISTVSRVLSPGAVPHPVAVETAARVRTAARELNFTPSPLARGLAARRSGLIGLIVPDLADPHYPQIAGGVEDGAREIDMAVLICNTFGDLGRMMEYLQLLEQRRVEAIVLSGGTSLNARGLLALQQVTVPLVLIGRPAIHVQWPYVTVDNRQGARDATRHLLERGFERILHVSGSRAQTTMADRVNGYFDAMGSRKTEVMETSGSPEDGEIQLRERLRSGPAIDAVFAATDRLAIAAMAVAADLRMHVPRDLAIIGFDDIALARFCRPALSTVAQPAEQLGEVAVNMVQRLTAGEVTQPTVLPAQLRARESTLGPGGRYS
jgi:LacI family transcriptional regulator